MQLNSRKLKKVFIALLLFLLVYLAFIFTSYFTSWKFDENLTDISFWELFSDDTIQAKNLGGKLGFYISNIFIKNMFGIASFSFILALALVLLRILGLKEIKLRHSAKSILTYTILTSIFSGLLIKNNTELYAGDHGKFMAYFLTNNIGYIGSWLLLIVISFLATSLLFEKFSRSLTNTILEKLKVDFRLAPMSYDEIEARELNLDVHLEEEQPSIEVDETISDDYEEESEEPSIEIEVHDDSEEKLPTVSADIEENNEQPTIVIEAIEESDEQPNIIIEEPKEEIEHKTEIKTKEPQKPKEIEIEVQKPKEETIEEEMEEPSIEVHVEEISSNEENLEEPFDPKKDLSNFQNPSLSILLEYESENEVDNMELKFNQDKIVDTLKHYGIEIVKIRSTIGPTITLYEVIPAKGTRVSKIKNLEDDIAMSLAAEGIRIIAPMPGKGTVGIEVPNKNPETVSMKSILASKKFQETKYELPVAIGKTIDNKTFTFDLAKAPHLLMAGATGQGKSVGLNAIITSLLYKKHPAELKFVLIDPKKVELSLYDAIKKHYLAKEPNSDEIIINDTKKVINTLNAVCVEMDNRYNLLQKAYTRNIKEYNEKFKRRRLNPDKGHKFLPYIVVVIDEFADLIMTAGKEVEHPIARIAQLARAVGIHMIIATQRPSTNIITGTIKANFPTRIAFKVSSMVDSRTILDEPGANKLIGRGDMLYSFGTDKTRLQCAFIDTPELEEVLAYIGKQQSYTSVYELPEYVSEGEDIEEKDIDLKKRDAKFEEAARLIVFHQQGSTSLIQRKMEVGFNRAGRIMDQLEAAEIVGPARGSKPRDVFVHDEMQLDEMLRMLP